jgi:hypothetical protein
MIGLLHFVFGLEMTVNCLRQTPFGRLPTWTPLVNVAIALALYFGVVASSLLVGTSASECYASITFLAASLRLNRQLIGTLSAMMPILLVMAAVIAVQLLRTIHVEPCQRVAGTRMVFYLVLSVIQIVSSTLVLNPKLTQQAFLLPFFSSTFLSDGETKAPPMSATMAEYVLYVFGTAIAFLHLFLRANAARTAIKPPEAPWHKRRRFRLFGPSELEIITISPPLHLVHPDYYPHDEKRAHGPASPPGTPSPALPFPVQTPTRGHARAGSMAKETPESPGLFESPFRPQTQSTYSAFPGAEDLILPATVYTPPPPRRPSYAVAQRTRSSSCVSLTACAPPAAAAHPATKPEAQDPPPSPGELLRPPRPPWAPAHRRGRSDDGVATVRIGLRLSAGEHAAAAAAAQRSQHRSLLAPSRPRRQGRAPAADAAAAAALDGGRGALSAALGEQTRGATGRDLNSFRWLDEEAQREAVEAPGGRRSSDAGAGAPGHAFSLLPGARPRADAPSICVVEPPRTAPVREGGAGGARWI